jgi:hypothetical protein
VLPLTTTESYPLLNKNQATALKSATFEKRSTWNCAWQLTNEFVYARVSGDVEMSRGAGIQGAAVRRPPWPKPEEHFKKGQIET